MSGNIGGVDVSRETEDRLKSFSDLLEKWNRKINLVGPATIGDLWNRHVVDSAQVFHVKQSNFNTWVDIGSGAGLPGLICAVLASEHNPDAKFTLIESDQRKAAFLRTASREMGISTEVRSERIEKSAPCQADVLSARALADLSQLLEYAERHLNPTGVALLQKGASWKSEVQKAQEKWQFSYVVHNSITNEESTILEIGEIQRV